MSRLDEECIMAVIKHRSGVDSGEIDYSIMVERFNSQSVSRLQEILDTLEMLKIKVVDRMKEIG